MSRFFRIAFCAVAIAGLVGVTSPTGAEQPVGSKNGTQLAFHSNPQTANLPVGTVRLRVITRVGGPTVHQRIKWRVMTYGRDANGDRHLAAEAEGATPQLVLPAAWYIVHAELPNRTQLKHPIEVTAGRIFKYTLVNK